MIGRPRSSPLTAIAGVCLAAAMLAPGYSAAGADAPTGEAQPGHSPDGSHPVADKPAQPAGDSWPVTAGPEHAPAAPEPQGSGPARPPVAAPDHASDEIRGLLKLGAALTERGDYEAGEIAFRQVMNGPDAGAETVKSALLGLARLHRRQGALTKAVAIYERYLKDNPGDERSPDVLLDLGRTLRALGIHRLAINRFYSVLNSTLKLTGAGFAHYQLVAKTAQFEIAQTHFEAGEFAEANKYFTRLRLLDLAPADRARAHFMSACALRLQGELETAVTTLRAFIEQSPGDENIPEARHLLALALRDLRRPQEALATTLELLRAEQSHTAAEPKRWAYWQRRTGNQLANDFFESGDALNAHVIYESLRNLSDEPAWRLPLTYQIALCFERLGLLDRAQRSYQAIVETAGPTPPAELAELVRMTVWRLEHLNWQERVERQVTSIFSNTTGQTAAATPPRPSTTASAP